MPPSSKTTNLLTRWRHAARRMFRTRTPSEDWTETSWLAAISPDIFTAESSLALQHQALDAAVRALLCRTETMIVATAILQGWLSLLEVELVREAKKEELLISQKWKLVEAWRERLVLVLRFVWDEMDTKLEEMRRVRKEG